MPARHYPRQPAGTPSGALASGVQLAAGPRLVVAPNDRPALAAAAPPAVAEAVQPVTAQQLVPLPSPRRQDADVVMRTSDHATSLQDAPATRRRTGGPNTVDDSQAGTPRNLRRHDPQERRRSKRSGKETGAWVYVSAHALQQAGFRSDEPAPFYRTWGSRRGSVLVRLYRDA